MGRPPTAGHRFHVFAGAPDGSGWEQIDDGPVYLGQDAFSLAWNGDRIINYQTSYHNFPKRMPDNMGANVRRVLHVRTSPDGLHWTPGGSFSVDGEKLPDDQLILPDERDPDDVEFYKFSTFRHADLWVGSLVTYVSQPDFVPKMEGWPHGPQLGAEWWLSRDGLSWQRPYRRSDAPLDALPMSFLYGLTTPLRAGRLLRWNCAGRLFEADSRRLLGVGCRSNASIVTPELERSGVPLRLHVSFESERLNRSAGFRQGYVALELLDAGGNVVPGFEREKCVFEVGSGDVLEPRWEGRPAPAAGTIRLRIMLRDARVYSLEL
jgi:hypothetical protein